jgi:hypothetical protein
MSEEMKGLLASVAREYWGADDYDRESLTNLLTRRLLPLLEAGQAMRDAGKIPINFVQELGEAQRAWDKAKGEAGT